MKNILVIFCFISFGQLHAQLLNQENITGEWICKDVSFNTDQVDPKMKNDPEMMKKVEMIKKGFMNVRFIFKADGVFNLHLPKEKSELMNELSFLNNKKWFFDAKRYVISVGTPQENLLQMLVKGGNGSLTFSLLDSPISLRMEKM